MGQLIKSVAFTHIPGAPAIAGRPATLATPGYYAYVHRIVCPAQTTVTRVVNVYPGQNLFEVLGYPPGTAGVPGITMVSAVPKNVGTNGVAEYIEFVLVLTGASPCYSASVLTYFPPVAGSPGIPSAAPTAAQIRVSLNVGWNSYARSIGQLDAGTYLEYTVKLGTTGALLAVGYAGKEGSPLSAFTHGLMTDVSTVSVFESGSIVATLGANAPGTKIRIARLSDGRIVYSIGNAFHISTASAYLPQENLYVYGMLYSGYDEVSSAAFVASDLISETTATIAGIGSLTAIAEQFVEARISGAGSFIASRFTTANISGTGAFSVVAEQATESSIAGVGNFWVYAEASRPPTATIAGVGSLGASPFPTAIIAGVGSLSAFTNGSQSATISGVSRLVIEAYQGRLTESTISGIGKLLAFADVGGRGYGELPLFVGIGGDTDYIQGYGTLPLFVSGAINGQSDYVPPEINRGYGNLPFIVGSARGVDIGIGTGSAVLPLFVGVAGDYNYGFASGNLPMFVGVSYGDFIAADEMILISPMLGSMSFEQQIDLVMIFTSTGQLESAQAMTRLQALELLSAMQAASALDMLGVYGYSFRSDMQGLSVQTLNIGARPDLHAGGVVWAINRETGASSQYEQYGFNSFFQRADKYYGVADDGIYLLEGDTDAGAPIDALIETGRTNLGYTNEKRVRDVYLGVGSSNELYLKVDVDNQTYVYSMRTSGQAVKNRPVEVGWGVKGDYWDFTLVNPDGADFNLASISFMPIPLARRG